MAGGSVVQKCRGGGYQLSNKCYQKNAAIFYNILHLFDLRRLDIRNKCYVRPGHSWQLIGVVWAKRGLRPVEIASGRIDTGPQSFLSLTDPVSGS
jgi:hypothetical protein